jgi:hypothetical protein
MKNKLLPFLLLLFCSVNAVSGCGRDTKSKNDVSRSDSMPIEQNITDTKKVENEKADITNISICGNTLVFPFKFGELGNDYKLENGVYDTDDDYTLYDMYNSKDYICTIAIEGDKTDNNSDKKVVLVDVKSPDNGYIEINGLDYKTTIEDFASSLGETSIKTESYLEYKKGNIILSLIFDNTKGELSNIMLIEERK